MKPRSLSGLTAPFAVLSVLLLICAIGAAWSIREMQDRAAGPIAASIESMTAAQELEISVRELSTNFNRYLITTDKHYLEPVPEIQKRIDAAMRRADEASANLNERTLMARIHKGYDRFEARYKAMILNVPREDVYGVISKEIDPILNEEILEPTHEYLRLNDSMLTQASETNRAWAQRLTIGLVILGLTGAVGGLIGGAVIASTIRRNQQRTEDQLNLTAEQLDRAVSADAVEIKVADGSQDGLARVATSATAVLQKLRLTERDALRAEQLAWVGQIAAGIAHEIRNPLMAIKLLVQAAADRGEGAAFKPRDLEVLEEEIVRVEQIVSGFLDYARPPRAEPRPVNVQDLIERSVSSVKARAELQGVDIVIAAPSAPQIVSVDPNQLQQVIVNLLFNSIDAQPRGGRISILAKMQDAPFGLPELVLEFKDQGPGLPVELGERIFEPFVTTKETGLGLGLSICRRIVESHGGRLTARSLPRQGSAFTLCLPAA